MSFNTWAIKFWVAGIADWLTIFLKTDEAVHTILLQLESKEIQFVCTDTDMCKVGVFTAGSLW